jgi:prepilin-type N-terminal cleavage/methylation domain-containing protein
VHRRRGFTLVEAIIATLVVSVLTVAALNTIPAAVEGRLRNERMARAMALAQDLMGEIDTLPWDDPDSPGGPISPGPALQRNQYNDCDDYNAWTESPPTDRDGTAYPGMDSWSRSVVVEFVRVDAPGTVSASRTTLKRVTVSVAFRGVPLARLVRLRSSAWDADLPDRVAVERVLTDEPLGADAP